MTTTPASRFGRSGLGRSGWLVPKLLVPFWLIASAVWLFLWIGDEVGEGSTHRVDEALMLAFRVPGQPAQPLGPVSIQEFARDVTALGSPGVLTAVVVAVVGFLMLAQRPRMAALVTLATAGGALWSTLLKMGYARPRPDLVPHAVHVSNASFPSGHALGSTVVYLTLAALLSRLVKRPAQKLYLIGCAVLVAMAVGVSRVYLGVHWPTDVVAGWAAGLGWALICWTLSHRFLQPDA